MFVKGVQICARARCADRCVHPARMAATAGPKSGLFGSFGPGKAYLFGRAGAPGMTAGNRFRLTARQNKAAIARSVARNDGVPKLGIVQTFGMFVADTCNILLHLAELMSG